ncbi:MAG: ROK family protein [Elusimicrobiota bacterium]
MRRDIGLGVDVGGTFAKMVLVDGRGRVLLQGRIPSSPEKGPERFVARLARSIREFERRSPRRPGTACLAVAGDVDPAAGCVRRSPNLPAFEGFPLRDALTGALERPVCMHNDANMAAWGAYALELGRRYDDVVTLTLGTGVGGGVVLGGRLHTGATGSAGEAGHMRVVFGGETCGCGAKGCLEAYAGKYGILRLAAAAGLKPRDPAALAEAAAAGDRAARAVWLRVGEALGVGIVNLVYLLNPEAVVITGGISAAGRHFIGPIRRALSQESFRAAFDRVHVHLAKRAELGVLGAALYSLEP